MYLRTVMSNYLNESSFEVENSFRPLSVKKSEWEYSDKSIKRVFEFEKRKFVEAFAVEIIKYKRESDADIELRFRDLKIGIIVHSYANVITELEKEAIEDIDKIRKDVMYYYADKKWKQHITIRWLKRHHWFRQH